MASLEMTDEQTNWADVAKILGGALLPFTLVWRFIDKFFKDKSEERIALINDVARKAAQETVKEAMREFVSPLQNDIKEVNRKMEDGFRDVHQRIDELLK